MTPESCLPTARRWTGRATILPGNVQGNLDLFRGAIEDFRRASSQASWETWLPRVSEILDSAIEWDASEVPVPDIAGVYRGKEAVLRWWGEWLAAWETVEFEYELVGAGAHVVALLDQRMRGRSTGIEVSLGEYAQLATFKDGLIVHWKLYSSQSEALKAARLHDRQGG